MTTVRPHSLLRTALLVDAAGSGALALLQLLATDTLAPLLGVPAPVLLGTGLFFVAYVTLLVLMARAAQLPVALVWLVVVGNAGWAVGCVGAMLSGWLQPSAAGVGYLLFQAVAVLLFATLQRMGLARSTPLGGAVLQA